MRSLVLSAGSLVRPSILAAFNLVTVQDNTEVKKQMNCSQQNTVKALIEMAKSLPNFETLCAQFGEDKADSVWWNLQKAEFALHRAIEILKTAKDRNLRSQEE